MQQRPKEHDNGTRSFRSRNIHFLELEASGRGDLEVVVFEPLRFHADAIEDLDDTVHFFDACNAVEGGLAFVEQASAEKGDSSVLARLELDSAF